MDDALARLRWLQLHDTAFPSGRFVHSNGLESWLVAHPDAGEDEVAELAESYLSDSVGTLDAVAAGHAWWATTSTAQTELDRLVGTFKLAASARTASESAGRQLALIARRVFPEAATLDYLVDVAAERVPGNDAVVEGVLCRALGIDRHSTVLGYLRSRYAGLLSAAVRLGRVGPIWAQQRTHQSAALLLSLTAQALTTDLSALSSTTPDMDIHAMHHESTTTRLFTT